MSDASLGMPGLLRYDGADRRRSRAAYHGPERRVTDPSTEQDHAELWEPAAIELQLAK
ncbi:MAG TPA: hypothetical protein VNU64_21005 [Burkholderiales bacterium]|nr:hypothetical protein [Burkholderiales bacterium]